ncbi:MAG: SDR family NAD(P)-dependent oxidoreductase [Alphaproteobacteria bacterium]|nr:SDR family NAD(P)-dependent oxidoreductase [Alphaproteobacteria bacterium]
MAEPSPVAVVTGGASGIGLAIARHLAGEGMEVIAVDRDGDACARVRAAPAEGAGRVQVVEGDIGTPEGAALAIDSAIKAFGRLDLLCNNAAVHPRELIEDHDLETWRETFRVNVDGAMLCSQRALPHMKDQGRGAIVNIGSISGTAPYATGGAYAASKAAIAMLTKVLAIEAAPYGVTVNCIAPGAIGHRPGAAGQDQSAPAHIPIGRRGTPADVAHLVSYLASEAAGYLTGAVIVLDGGVTAGRVRR